LIRLEAAHPAIVSTNRSARHTIRKTPVAFIHLRAGHGVAGDAHFGSTVQHRYDRKRDPARSNLRQVHLIGMELYAELTRDGDAIVAGALGENITTRDIDLTSLPQATRLQLGRDAVIEVTGLRAPCSLIERVRPGARAAAGVKRNGIVALRWAIMAVVVADGDVRAGDEIVIVVPPPPLRALRLV
jgi:MOSC domain-containing protein YiiM